MIRSTQEIKNWLLTGVIPEDKKPQTPINSVILDRLKKVRRDMRKRDGRTDDDMSEMVTNEELLSIFSKSNYRCAVSGHLVHFSKEAGQLAHWKISLDHIKPLKYCRHESAG